MIVFGEVRDGGFGPGVAAQAASEIRRVAEGMSAERTDRHHPKYRSHWSCLEGSLSCTIRDDPLLSAL